MNIYDRLFNDIYSSMYQNVYFLNQEGNINVPNKFTTRGWKYYIDGGAVKKNTSNYGASYTFDYESDSKYKKVFSFTSYKGIAGLNLINFIESVINADANIFIKRSGLITKDARKYLFEVLKINISDSVIDNICIDILKKYFHNLEQIEFINCKIKNECSFDKINVPIYFRNCKISNMRSFNNCSANINFIRTNIDKISPSTIMSKELCISKNSCINLKELFLKCNFPKLEKFDINAPYGYSFEDSFTYLPYAAPKLENLCVKYGKVRNLDFLTKFRYLRKSYIDSIETDDGLAYVYVTDGVERKKILNRNHEAYEVSKILYPYKNEAYIISELENKRILKLCNFLSRIDYTEDDLSLFTKDDFILSLLNKANLENVEKYYLCYYDKLYLEKSPDLPYATAFEIPDYKILLNKYLYEYQEDYSYMKHQNKQIVKTSDFIYGPNGLPIIFKNMKRQIETVEQAKEYMKDNNIKNHNYRKENYEELLKYLKTIKSDFSIGELIDVARESFYTEVDEKNFKNIENSNELCAVFFKYNKANKRLDFIEDKNKQYKILIEKIIMDHYDLFSVAEKAYLYKHQFDYLIKNISDTKEFEKMYLELVTEESEIYKSINNKTRGLYGKYYNFLKLTYKQMYLFDSPYNIVVKEDYVKKLKI